MAQLRNRMSFPFGVVAARDYLRVKLYVESPTSDLNEAGFPMGLEHKTTIKQVLKHSMEWDAVRGKKEHSA